MKRALKVVVLLAGISAAMGGIWAVRVANTLRGGDSIADVFKSVSNPRALFPNKNRVTVLVVGRDYNHNKKGVQYTKDSRADTMMAITVDLETAKLTALSIPRDTRITGSDGVTGKANGLLSRGGVQLLTDTLSHELGIPSDYYVLLKADAVRNIVDALGGVKVTALDEMKYVDNWGGLNIDLPAGPQIVDGKGAEGFVRFRSVNRTRMDSRGNIIRIRGVKASLEEGDIRRTARQQQLIRAMMEKAVQPATLVRLSEILDVGFNQIETNMDRTQVLALASLLRKGTGGMLNATLPGTDAIIGDAYYYELDTDRSRRMVAWLVQGDVYAGRSLVRVDVLNGSKITGVSRLATQQLEGLGYDARTIGNDDDTPRTVIQYRGQNYAEAAKHVARQLGVESQIELDDDPRHRYGSELRIVVGNDIAAKIKSLDTGS